MRSLSGCVFLLVLGLLLTGCVPSVADAADKTSGQPLSSPVDYVALARHDAQQVGLSPDRFVRQIEVESHFNPRACSPAGAQGIAQFMPATAKELHIDPWNPAQALAAAARLMARYVHQFDGDYAKALASYNAGPAAVATAVARGGSAWRSYVPTETQAYIVSILEDV